MIDRLNASLVDLGAFDVRLRLHALDDVLEVAQALGGEKCSKELVPYLASLRDDDEEVLLRLADVLGKLAPTSPLEVVPLFDLLLDCEDARVRMRAYSVLRQVVQARPEFCSSLYQLALQLHARKGDSALISAVRICCEYSSFFPQSDAEAAKAIIEEAVYSSRPIVRSHTARSLGTLLDQPESAAWGLGKLIFFLQDKQECVVVAAADTLCEFGLISGSLRDAVAPVLLPLLKSPSWRVRHVLTAHLHRLFLLTRGSGRSAFFERVMCLLIDEEPLVAVHAIEAIEPLLAEKEAAEGLLCVLPGLLGRPENAFRVALAKTVPKLAVTLDEKHLHKANDLLTALSNEESSEVRGALLASTATIKGRISEKEVNEFVRSVALKLLEDCSWRTRNLAITSLQAQEEKLGESFFSDPLVLFALQLRLEDRVYQVRMGAVSLLLSLARLYGQEFAEQRVFPLLTSFATNRNYLKRHIYLAGLTGMALLVSSRLIEAELPVLARLLIDPVPAIRAGSLKVLSTLQSLQSESLGAALSLAHLALAGETDLEVKAVLASVSG